MEPRVHLKNVRAQTSIGMVHAHEVSPRQVAWQMRSKLLSIMIPHEIACVPDVCLSTKPLFLHPSSLPTHLNPLPVQLHCSGFWWRIWPPKKWGGGEFLRLLRLVLPSGCCQFLADSYSHSFASSEDRLTLLSWVVSRRPCVVFENFRMLYRAKSCLLRQPLCP